MGHPAGRGYIIPHPKRARCAECCNGASKRWRSAGNVSHILKAVECSCAAEAFRSQQIIERRERRQRMASKAEARDA